MLYRHWTLMDSLIHTPELMARIRTFKEGGPGRQVLMYILAQTGIPIHQVRASAAALASCARQPRPSSPSFTPPLSITINRQQAAGVAAIQPNEGSVQVAREHGRDAQPPQELDLPQHRTSQVRDALQQLCSGVREPLDTLGGRPRACAVGPPLCRQQEDLQTPARRLLVRPPSLAIPFLDTVLQMHFCWSPGSAARSALHGDERLVWQARDQPGLCLVVC